jgi:hypothetical protein
MTTLGSVPRTDKGRLEPARAFAARWAPTASRAATALGIVAALGYWWFLTATHGLPADAEAYWKVDPDALYPTGADWRSTGYLYSPAFELVAGWARLIPFDVFVAVWRGLLLAVLVYLAGPLTAPVLLTVPVGSEVNAGNIQLLLALAVVLGFRWPAAWAFVILTKLTPGVGLLWFAVRREWRHLGIALGVTAAIAAATALLWPERWAGYLHLLGGYAPPAYPAGFAFWDRLPWAIVVLVAAGWRGWRWPVVVGAMLAVPIFWPITPSMLVGVLPFLRVATGRWLHGESLAAIAARSRDGQETLPAQASSEAGAILGG